MLGIALLILSLIHVPIPQIDYHNIRHHDSPGQTCALHDHLLRWHPLAAFEDDVVLLHWHWFLPLVEPGTDHQPADDDSHRPGTGPAFHVHIGDGLQAENWHGELVINPASRGRFVDQITSRVSAPCWAALSDQLSDRESGCLAPCISGPAGGLRASRAAFFQRWNC
jgi:hypothetical protein